MQDRRLALLADTRCAVPDHLVSDSALLDLKPAEIVWNGMTITDEPDALNRRLFLENSEINPRTSGLPTALNYPWAEFIADRSVDTDTLFLFHPDKKLFLTELDDLVKSAISLKIQHGDFLKTQGKNPQKVKLSLVDTGTWFGGVGLSIWQSLTYLKKLDADSNVSVSAIRQRMQQISRRSVHVTLIPAKQASKDFMRLAQNEGLSKRFSLGFSRDAWYGCCVCNGNIRMFDQASFETQLEQVLAPLKEELDHDKLVFPRVLVSASEAMYKVLHKAPFWQAIHGQQKNRGFQILNQLPGITAQVLMGKDAVHFSYAMREPK